MTDQEHLWERRVITKLAQASLKEQKRARRWSIFFKFLVFAYITFMLYLFTEPDISKAKIAKDHTALIELQGLIADGENASADNIVSALRTAFEDEKTRGVILRINSPGGTPVQAGYIYDEILRLREQYPDTPLYAVVSDMAASGGYYVASATDEIYVSNSSIVGSIGVRMDSFGVVDAMEKLGIESRTLTAGENKALLDPFSPVNEKAMQHLQAMIDRIHQQFIDAVKKGRGDRLKEADELFSGLIWTGDKAIEFGLVDKIGSASFVAREVIGAEDIVEYSVEQDVLERLVDRLGASTAKILNKEYFSPRLH
ncbi:MAG: signal peptide peptidase SppA [Gammaproteobacteria bacterium]|nr:signal peptide peptidase SppA [Gammaproteobacteria bacterium]NNL06311.1 signal peptide peptidase SppA [Gammaproteobacteria bacterium]